jgi:hypothetical protein
MHVRTRLTRAVAIVATTASLLSLSACGSATKTATKTDAEASASISETDSSDSGDTTETSESAAIQTVTVPVVEAPEGVLSNETAALAPTEGAGAVVANPNFPAAAPEVPTQTVEACEPLAKAYNEAATTWLAVKVIAESELAVRKSFDNESTARVRVGLATLRTELAADQSSLDALATIERGFSAILAATGSGASESADELVAFVKEVPDLASVPKPISTALRSRGCVVVDY